MSVSAQHTVTLRILHLFRWSAYGNRWNTACTITEVRT